MLTLLSWNVNGLRAVHKKGFQAFVKKYKPDILCLQETKAHLEQLPEELVKIDAYHSFFSEAEKKGYSGTALYSRLQPRSLDYGIGKKKFDSEGRYLIAEFDDFLLFNIYFPNGKMPGRLEYKMDFYNQFLKYIKKPLARGRKIIVCGDVNTAHREIDLARPKANQDISGFLPQERKWIDKFIEAGFIDTFREFNDKPENYTWWDYKSRARERNVGWRIDYFFVSKNMKEDLRDAFILPEVQGSDHCPVGIKIKL